MTNQKKPNIPSFNSSEYGLLSPNGTNPNGSGQNVDQFVANTSNGIALMNKAEYNLSCVKTITSAQILALNATPITVLPALATGFAYLIDQVTVRHGTGTAYADIAAGEDWVLKYTNAAGAECSGQIELTGFLDQTTAQIRSVLGTATTPVDAAAVVLHQLVGEVTTGDFDCELLIQYRIIPTDFAGI